jgi:hypothetical protein
MSVPYRRLICVDEAREVPVLGRLGVGELPHVRRDDLLDPAPDLVRQVVALEHAAALLVDDHALRVHHVVVLEDVLARDEVLLLDLLLRVLDLRERIDASIGWSSGILKRSMIPWIRSPANSAPRSSWAER